MRLEENVLQVPIEQIIPNRFQPRLNFDDRGLEELASSIKEHGIIQPLVLRRVNDKYEIIAGERRYKAACLAGLKTVPAIIADIDDNKSAEVAIVENVQRKALTPIEEARSYKNLLDKGYLTQAELAKKMGLSQSAIANKLRLLNLDEEVQQALLNNQISERHARSLLVLPNNEEQKRWLNKILEERLTVRELDDAIKAMYSPTTKTEEETDIPLVRPIDIEAIKKEATELPRLDQSSEIARKLQEIENERKYNPEVIPVDQARNDAKGNFFNFLENEKVNMNMEENNIEIPATPKIIEPIKQELTNQERAANFNYNFVQNTSAPLNNDFAQNPSAPVNNNFVQNPNATINNSFDPVNLIDTLDPMYTKKQEEKQGIDLKSAINSIREAKDNLSAKGFVLSLEETDLSDAYQFIIKIKKN